MKRLLLLSILANPLWAALPSHLSWDVRGPGADTNGGGFASLAGTCGTDFSTQNSAQIAYTDLVIGATTTQFTSSAHAVTSAIVCNVIQVVSGSGCTTGFFVVVSQAAGVATVDRSLGTAASTCSANLGGGLQTIAAAVAASVTENEIHIQSGTYTLTTGITHTNKDIEYYGYQTTHGDQGTRPLITTATNSNTLFTTPGFGHQVAFSNINMSNTASVRAVGVLSSQGTVTMAGVTLDGFTLGVDSTNAGSSLESFRGYDIEVKNCSTIGLGLLLNNGGDQVSASSLIQDSYIHDNAVGILAAATNNRGGLELTGNVIAANTGNGVSIGHDHVLLAFRHNTVAGNGADGIGGGTGASASYLIVRSNLIYGNTGTGISYTGSISGVYTPLENSCNGYGGNGTNTVGITTGAGAVTVSSDPFVNSGAGNYALNGVGGAVLKGVGCPGTFPGGTTTGAGRDIGAVQSSGGGSGSGGQRTYITAH